MRNEEILQHHGIKGMRWGVRRSKDALSKAGSSVAAASKVVGSKTASAGKAVGKKTASAGKAVGKKTKDTVDNVKKKTNEGVDKVKTRVKEEIGSKKRELDWAKDLDNINKMTTKELQTKTNRIRLENEMKSLTKSGKNRTEADFEQSHNERKQYRTRDKLSDKELQSKVEHLRAKDLLRREISNASKGQRDKAKEIISEATDGIDKYSNYANIGKQVIDFKYGKY